MGRNMKKFVVDGSIELNGHPVECIPISLAGYVRQNNLFIGTLTVKEHLMFEVLCFIGMLYRFVKAKSKLYHQGVD